MSQPTPMKERPRIREICYISAEGNPHTLRVGSNGVADIRETEEPGEYCMIPWLEVWSRDSLIARFNQHKVEHIFYGAKP
jgi:hypothetical protein